MIAAFTLALSLGLHGPAGESYTACLTAATSCGALGYIVSICAAPTTHWNNCHTVIKCQINIICERTGDNPKCTESKIGKDWAACTRRVGSVWLDELIDDILLCNWDFKSRKADLGSNFLKVSGGGHQDPPAKLICDSVCSYTIYFYRMWGGLLFYLVIW